MKSMGAWLGRLAMAGICLTWAGCGGGGDVPDPDSDSRAAGNEPSRPRPRQQAEDQPEPPAVASNDAPKAEPEAEKPAPKGDSSGTDEMLKTPAPTPPANPSTPSPTPKAAPGPSEPGPSPPNPSGPPTGPDMRNRGRSAPPSGPPGEPGSPRQGMRAPAPVGPGGPDGPGQQGGPGGNNGRPGGPGFGLAGQGGPGGRGGPGSNEAPNFHFPNTAVTAFLNALKAKDKDRLTQATAKRAPTEAVEKHQKIFSEIVDGSISDEDLDEIAKSFDGFAVQQVLNAKSTGRIGVVVAKAQRGGGYLQRTIMTRLEKEGWKVLDVEDLYEFKPMMQFGTSRGRTKSNK